jgi:hypothetical protein
MFDAVLLGQTDLDHNNRLAAHTTRPTTFTSSAMRSQAWYSGLTELMRACGGSELGMCSTRFRHQPHAVPDHEDALRHGRAPTDDLDAD